MAGYDNVIVGGGLAGGMIGQSYREAGGSESVLIVGREQRPPYHRPPLTKEFLRGDKPAEETYMHPAEWWSEQQVDLRLGTEVAAVDPAAKEIQLADGERIGYRRLALATGSTARPFGDALTIRTIEDSERVAEILARGSGHLAVIGGGFIGVETAASARMKGLDVTLVMENAVVWDHLFGPEVGAYFERHLTDHGVHIVPNQNGLPEGLQADAVVAGIGATPNLDLARAAGLAVERGVHVNDHLQAATGIWAVGDIAEYESVVHGGRRIRVEHWDVALNHGDYLGKLWAGATDEPYDVVPYFFSDIGDWTWMEYVGPGSGQVEIRGSMADDDFVAWYTDPEGRVTACLAVNRSDDIETAKELIKTDGKVPAA
jgi:3-phenylpropionate/trans-cinnamate dioxygenase ferredoxin reductase subunit